MQDQNNNNNNSYNTKDYYNQSVLKTNLIQDYVSELSANEVIDNTVEKVFLYILKESLLLN